MAHDMGGDRLGAEAGADCRGALGDPLEEIHDSMP